MTLDLPDARDHDFSSQVGRQTHLDAWRLFENKSSILGHKLAACSALAKRDRLTTIIAKVSRFVERSREFALRAIEAYKTFEAALQEQNKEEDIFKFISIFGKPKELKRREFVRNKRMMAISDKITKEYDRFWRERELLRTQIQALVPELNHEA